MTIHNALENFIRSRYRKGLSDKTIESYRLLTARFVSYFGADFEMENITQENIDCFIDSLYAGGLARNSIASYIRNTRIFLKWYGQKNPVNYSVAEIPVPKTPKKILRLYSPHDIELIFEKAEVASPWLTARNRAIIALMLDSGLRQGEVCCLKKKDVDFDNFRLKVCGKGNKERFVPLGKLATKFLKDYFAMCPYEDSENVFVSYHGKDLSCGAVKSMTWDIQEKLPFEFSSHKLRHNFATNYLLNQYEQFGQMDIYSLMTIMGHEDVATVRRYLHDANNILSSRTCISHLDKLFAEAV